MARVHAHYILLHRRIPNILAPRRYTEKIQWRKLFDMDPVYAILSDKLAVRSFIASKVGEAQLVPLFWSGRPQRYPIRPASRALFSQEQPCERAMRLDRHRR
jgi:hypothetical protein